MASASGSAARPLAVVTGANGTFGRHICAGLISSGMDVVAVVRNPAKGKDLAKFIAAPKRFQVVLCDLSSPKAIQALPSQLPSKRPVQCLVNNAAITPKSRQVSKHTEEEMQWCVNVLGYHRVTAALLPHLAPTARVVMVASFYAGDLKLEDPMYERRPYDVDSAYRSSKQANRMLACAWAQHLSAQPTTAGISVVSCHPGIATSGVSLGLGYDLDRSLKAAQAGAVTPIFCALQKNKIRSGGYYANEKLNKCPFCSDKAAVTRLWTLCNKKK